MNTTLWLVKAQFCSCLLEGTPWHLFFCFFSLMQCMPFYTMFPLDEIHAWARSQKKMPFYTLISELTGQTSGCYGNGGLGRFCMRSHKLRFVNYQPLQLGICLGSAVYFQWWTLLTLLEICKYYLPSSVRTHSTLLWYSPGSNKIRLHCNSCWENSGLLDPWSCHMLLSCTSTRSDTECLCSQLSHLAQVLQQR